MNKEVDVTQRLTPNQNLFLGMYAGVLCTAVIYPIDNWKNMS
jgi:hypothetical protein